MSKNLVVSNIFRNFVLQLKNKSNQLKPLTTMKAKIGKSMVAVSVILLVVSLATANIVGTIASMASVTYSTALSNDK